MKEGQKDHKAVGRVEEEEEEGGGGGRGDKMEEEEEEIGRASCRARV